MKFKDVPLGSKIKLQNKEIVKKVFPYNVDGHEINAEDENGGIYYLKENDDVKLLVNCLNCKHNRDYLFGCDKMVSTYTSKETFSCSLWVLK